MNVKRIFDFSALAMEKFPKEDCLVTKKMEIGIKHLRKSLSIRGIKFPEDF
jgi:hypothetical protein